MIKKEARNAIGSLSYLKKVNTHFLSIWNIFSVSSVFRLTRILNNLIGPNNHVTPQVWWRLSKASLPLVQGSVYCCSNHTANSAWFLVPVFLLLLTTHDINPFPPKRRQSACPKSVDDWWLKGCMWRSNRWPICILADPVQTLLPKPDYSILWSFYKEIQKTKY